MGRLRRRFDAMVGRARGGVVKLTVVDTAALPGTRSLDLSGGGVIAAKGGRRYAADITRVKWQYKGRDNAHGLPGYEPVPVYRIGREVRAEYGSRTNRPAAGLTIPRRPGAHG